MITFFLENAANYYGGAIALEAEYDIQILDNYFEDNSVGNGGGSIYISNMTAQSLIEGNFFTGGDADYGTAIHNWSCSMTINQNYFIDIPGISAIKLASTGPISTISNNFIIRPAQNGIDVSNSSDSPHQVINNTIVNAGNGIIAYSGTQVNALNNIITGSTDSIHNLGGSFTGSNNLFFGNTTNSNPLDAPVYDDPLFVSPGTDDYHIQEDSPAINAGTTVSLDEDYDGESRPMGGGYDIGADEVSSGYLAYLPLVLK